MKTPKEKAKELVFWFLDSFGRALTFETAEAKLCATKIVNEILKVYSYLGEEYVYSDTEVYWMEVKKEIEEL